MNLLESESYELRCVIREIQLLCDRAAEVDVDCKVNHRKSAIVKSTEAREQAVLMSSIDNNGILGLEFRSAF